MSEIRIGEIPLPLINYVNLIRSRRSPYFDVVQFLIKEMERHYLNAQKDGQSEIVYMINPRVLTDEIELLVQSQAKEKLTNITVCRTIQAFCLASKLKEGEDFYVSTTSSGRKNYHIKVNQRTLNAFRMIL
jgi:hypothetical protein